MPELVYVDSNVFILPVVGEKSDRAAGAVRVLERIEKGTITAFTSVLTWDEVVWVVSKLMGEADGKQVGRKLLTFPGLRFLDVTPSTLARSQGLCEELDLRPRDAIHCASAISKGIKTVISDDKDIEKVPGFTRKNLETFVS
ncbi:MAG: type II toxin-antitoxin system VapC family toxin [Nitrososphaerota archaeon]|nr:type II toxin-antitoxin system VapC family toxin [Nitrososphaerota archaeon]